MKYISSVISPREIIKLIKQCQKFIIDTERDKNKEFMIKYNVDVKTVQYIISKLTERNYVRTIPNEDRRIKTDYLHIFYKDMQFTDFSGSIEIVKIFIKIGFVKNNIIAVVSFHEDGEY